MQEKLNMPMHKAMKKKAIRRKRINMRVRAGVYVASRVKRYQMWRNLRELGVHVTASWVDEPNEGDSGDRGKLWSRIEREIKGSAKMVLYAETEDFPLKGALVEAGIAIASGVPVVCVLPGVILEHRSMQPLGSWASHPLVSFADSLEAALGVPLKEPT